MDIKNFLKRKGYKVGQHMKKGQVNLNGVWKSVVIVFVIINVCVIMFSWYLFFQISTGGIFNIQQDINVSVETINRELLKDIITTFKLKENEFDKFKTSGTVIVDPSR